MIEIIVGSSILLGVYMIYYYSKERLTEYYKTPFHERLKL